MVKRRQYTGGMVDITDDFRRRQEEVSQPLKLDTGVYWWVWGKTMKSDGGIRRVLRGPYMSEEESWEAGNTLLGSGNFECVSLNTRDEAAASRIMRNKVAEETKDVEVTFRRFKHKFLKDRGNNIGGIVT
jgi:hypothetical protein